MVKHLLFICLLVICTAAAMAQKPDTTSAGSKTLKDSLVSTRQDTDVSREFKPRPKKEKVYHPDSLHNPHTAVIRSLIIPGWGQLYNHRWWKVPAIYGGLSLLGVAIVFNNTNYNEFLTLSKYREKGITPVPGDKYYAESQLYASQANQALYDATDGYRRDRDLCILGVLGAWGINVVDAYIDAKFQNAFTIDNNLGMKITPGIINQPMYAQSAITPFIPALKITFTMR